MTWTWLSLAGLGAVHGLNPGMGWLFAVALGMQEGRTRAVWRALPPLALGHALAIAAAVLGAAAVGQLLPPRVLVWIVGGMLLGLGALRLVRHRHPRYGGMQVGFRELTTWSLLMATAHGAGLMVLPLLVGTPAMGSATPRAAMRCTWLRRRWSRWAARWRLVSWATALHSAGYLLVTACIAVVVYRKLGLRMLRTMWINLDLIWGVALMVTGAAALLA